MVISESEISNMTISIIQNIEEKVYQKKKLEQKLVVQYMLICSTCGQTCGSIDGKDNFHPLHFTSVMYDNGWKVKGDKVYCPKCN